MKKTFAILALTVAGFSITSQALAARQVCATVKTCTTFLGIEITCQTTTVCVDA